MSPTDAAPAPEEPAGQPKRNPLAYFFKKRNPLAYVGQAAAVVGLISGIAGLVFLFAPDLQRKASLDVGSFKIVASTVKQPVSFERYLQRVRLPPFGTKEFRQRRGILIEFDYVAEGFRGKSLPIQWDLVDAKTNDRVFAEASDIGGNGRVSIKPSTNDEAAKWFVWLPAPAPGRTYYVTVTIYQPRKGDVDVPLADFETPQFTGAPPA